MGCSGPPCFVWMIWTANLLISAVYLGISMVSFHNVKQGVAHLGDFPNKEAYKNSLLASCMLGFLIVLFWVIFSFFVLFGRIFSGLPLGYGVMLGSCSHTGFFMLLAGLVLQTHEALANQFRHVGIWNDSDYNTYLATFSFSYILCGSYLIMFLVLLFTSGAMTDKKRSDSYAAKSSPSAPAATPSLPPAAAAATSGTVSGVSSPPQDNHGFGVNWGGSYGRNV